MKKFYLHYSGLKVARDGEVIVPQSGSHPEHYTFGGKHKGHKVVKYLGKLYYVHIIVAEVFLNDNKPLSDGYDVHHIDWDGENNRVENLLIISHGEHSALHNKGKVFSKEHKQKLSELAKNRIGADSQRGRPIIGTNLKTGEIREFSCASEAERILHISGSYIRVCCKGKGKSAGGWRFEYKNPLSA